MTMIACPKCAESVALPERASRLATVRCPLCQEEFPLAEVLAQLPPALIVVADPQPVAAPPAEADSWDVSPEADELALRPAESVAGFAPLSIETEAPRPSASAATSRRRPSVGARKRPPKNPVMEGVKIVLGGIAGLVIAQVILWWVGSSQAWPKQRADMFQLAPKVARVLPWIVPERYRGERPASDAADASEFGAGAVASSGANTSGLQELPERTFVDPNAAGGADDRQGAEPAAKRKTSRAGGKSVPAAGNGTAAVPDGLAPAPALDVDLAEIPDIADSTLDDLGLEADMLADDEPIADPVVMPVEALAPPASPEAEPAAAEPAGAEPVAGPVRPAPRSTPAELGTAVEAARTAFSALQNSSEDDIISLLRQTYPVLAKLGETVARAAPGGEEWQAAGELVRDVRAEEEKLVLLGRVGGGWLRAPARDNDGVLLVGTVKQVRQQGPYRVTDLMLPGSDQTVAVYSAAEPGVAYPLDQRLVVFGAILGDPRSELEGYDGDAEYVVWQGLAEQLPAP